MKKAVALNVRIYIEGDDDPADDFAKLGQRVATQVVQSGITSYKGPFTLTIQKVEALEDSDE
ncbi:MAG TPA: hypothetical protein VIC85_04125 [Ktedonobacterales bacterium]|jgi:hypothetical protein